MVRDSAWREGRKTEPPDHLIQGTATLRYVGCGSLPRRCPFLPRMGETWSVARPSMFTIAGGEPAFRALAEAHHRRCLEDPVLAHPFSHPGNPEHVERLADYWAEVFGGPRRYSESFGGHSAMLELHARTGAEEDLGARFVACFVQRRKMRAFPRTPSSAGLRAYMEWAIGEMLFYSPPESHVAPDLPVPRWDWDGLQ